jgi:hypothetical protein
MRRFTLGSATGRKIVVIDVNGANLTVLRVKPDGTTRRQSQELPSEAVSRAAADQLARELLSRGYEEQAPSGAKAVKEPARTAAGAAKVAAPAGVDGDYGLPYDLIEEATEQPQPTLQRLATAPPAEPQAEVPLKKKKGKKKRKKKAEADGLDRRVIASVAAVGLLLLCGLGYMAYDALLKPPSIVGTWRGSNVDYEIGGMITHTECDLMLDENKRASISFGGDSSIGTYARKGDRLTLTFKDEEGESSQQEYKIVLGRATLDLKEPETGKLIVQLIRFREPPVVGQKKPEAPAAPTDVAPTDLDKADASADEQLASVPFSPKDNAFKIKYPQSWEADTGSRPDNTYSWAKFTKEASKNSFQLSPGLTRASPRLQVDVNAGWLPRTR